MIRNLGYIAWQGRQKGLDARIDSARGPLRFATKVIKCFMIGRENINHRAANQQTDDDHCSMMSPRRASGTDVYCEAVYKSRSFFNESDIFFVYIQTEHHHLLSYLGTRDSRLLLNHSNNLVLSNDLSSPYSSHIASLST